MAEGLTRGEVQDLISKFAAENPKYRASLLKDPKALVEKQLNAKLGSVNVKAVAETADTIYVVVPYVPGQGELSDADLEKVAGGKKDVTANCTIGGAGVANTVTQINLQ
jgi:hypothetical protein